MLLEHNTSEEDGVNHGSELTPQMKAEAQAIDAQLCQPSVPDLMREIEALKAPLESTPESDPAEEQKRSKRAADARWDKREQAQASSAPAVEGALPT